MSAIEPERVQALVERARREVDEGLLPSCQLALAYEGEVVAFETLGDARDDTRYAFYSATKPMVSAAIWALLGDGRLELDQRIAEVVPEFGSNGKDVVTLEHVLLHTAGLPYAPLGPPRWASREGRLAAFSEWRLAWAPGTRYEYHPTSAHWVLAEVIERVSGQDFRDFVEERVTAPAGLPRVLGLPAEAQGRIATLVAVGEHATPDELEATFGVRALPTATEVTEDALLRFNEPEVRVVGVPGGGGIGRASDLALFYQALLHNPGGMWQPAILADAVGHVRNRLPDFTGTPANRTLGLFQAGDDGYSHVRGLGRAVSPRAVGHNGAGGQIAWGDPATGLSFGYVTNGLDRHEIRQPRRGTALASLAGVCARR